MSTLMRRVHHVSLVAPYELCRVGDHGDAPVNPIDLADLLQRIEAFFARLHDGRRGAAVGRRRPSRHPADPARDRPRAAGRDRAFRRPFRHQRQLFRRREIHARHAVPPRDRGGADRPEADDPDRHPRLDVFGRREGLGRERRHPHRPYRGILPPRPGSGRSPRRAASSATARFMSASTSTGSTRSTRRAPARPRSAGFRPPRRSA